MLNQPKAPLRIGIIGLGRMGQNHLRVLSMLAGAELRFIYDLDTEAARRLGKAADVAVADDLDRALAGVEAVVIAAPTVAHEGYIRRCAEHVGNIFVEKPVTDRLDSSRAISDFVGERGINLQVGFIERFNPAVEQMKLLLDRSTQVVSVDFVRTNKLSARITDVDVVTDLMIHDIDLALYLNGPVNEVSAHGVANEGMIDFASALLSHVNGRFSRIQASRITDKKMRSIQATCRDMFIDCELLSKEITISRQSEIVQRPGEPYRITAMKEAIEVRPQEALLSELQAFIASTRGEREPRIPGPDAGVEAMAVCDAIQRKIAG